jgi:hypothetical protein
VPHVCTDRAPQAYELNGDSKVKETDPCTICCILHLLATTLDLGAPEAYPIMRQLESMASTFRFILVSYGADGRSILSCVRSSCDRSHARAIGPNPGIFGAVMFRQDHELVHLYMIGWSTAGLTADLALQVFGKQEAGGDCKPHQPLLGCLSRGLH